MAKDGKLYNDQGNEVTPFINAKRTEVYFSKEVAEKRRLRKRSYVYPIYDGAGNFHGYGVPA